MKLKSQIMDEQDVLRTLTRITHEVIEKNHTLEDLVLLGIRRRGLPLARILRDNLKKFAGVCVPLGSIDISLYRDDLSEIGDLPTAGGIVLPADPPCSVAGRKILLVDDVIYTGRTARAAIDAVFRSGRPRAIQLAVLIDRGHRELPIRPDYVGKNIPTSHTEVVSVMVDEFDGRTGVCLYQRQEAPATI